MNAMAATGTNGARPPSNHPCIQKSTIAHLTDEAQHAKARDDKQDEAILALIGNVNTLSTRIGEVRHDGTGTDGSLTKLVLCMGSKLDEIRTEIGSMRPKLDSVVEESEATQMMSREELVRRSHEAEAKLATIEAEEKKANREWKASVIKAILLLAAGGGGVTLCKQVFDLLIK